MNRAPPPPDASWAWFLDVDGTLATLAPTPDAVVVDEATLQLVAALQVRTEGAVALISGRSIRDIDLLFPNMSLSVAGQHGAERRNPRGRRTQHLARTKSLELMRGHLATLTARHPGLLLEDKGLSLALHYRRLLHLDPSILSEMRAVHTTYGAGFLLQRGAFVLEIVPAGVNKGTAVEEFMSEPPFRGRVPVFLGDDVTDEHAFLAVNDLEGHSIKVGAAATNARYCLRDVAAVQRWLKRL